LPSERETHLRETQHRLRVLLVCQRAEGATAEARFYAGRIRQAYWRGVRPGPGWRMPADEFRIKAA
jgi:hypothetical protein